MKTRSFIAVYRAKTGTLIGGVVSSQSSRWQRRSDAKNILETTIKNNDGNCLGSVEESDKLPEIILHCQQSIHPQIVGGKCFSCGATVTTDDIKKSQPIFD